MTNRQAPPRQESKQDHYRILGVPATASGAAIRTAYRRLAITLHPDRAGAGSTAAFQAAAAAYEVLKDPRKRARYDASLGSRPAGAAPNPARPGFIAISTPAPNQYQHWITIPPGTRDGDQWSSVVRIGEARSVVQLRIRLM